MAEEITKYTVAVSFDAAIKKLDSFEKKMTKFSKSQENSLKTQIGLQRQLNRLRNANTGRVKGETLGSLPKAPDTTPSKPKQSKDKMTAHMKERERHLVRVQKAEERRVVTLGKAQASAKRTALYQDKGRTAAEAMIKSAMRKAIAEATTADAVRDATSSARQRLRINKKSETSLRKQNFILGRMKESSKQYAGNMVGAFAMASTGAAIVKTGQDFESVNNTMLAVSENTEMAGKNFQFVRGEAFRLGLSLTESGKNFAKMLSAKGKMSLDDTKAAFSGVAEMSTLLGLSSEASTRAINALQQMMSKGVVSAEEFTVY